jgi:chromosome segregation ATPase
VIEVTLKNHKNEPNIVITREIYQNNKSDWHVNKKSSNESKVKALLAKFNIQLDNLCQFLPQEKVADFAKLSPKELLLETERAIDLTLLQQHEELIKEDNRKVELLKQYEAKKISMESLEKKKDEYEAEAKKYEEFRQKERELKLHQKLIPYAQIQDRKAKGERLKRERDEIRKSLDEYKTKIAPFLNAANSYDDEVQDFTNLIHDDAIQLDKVKQEIQQNSMKITELDNQREQLKAKIQEFQKHKQKKLETLEKTRGFLQENIQRRDNIQEFNEDDLMTAKAEANTIHAEILDLNTGYNDKRGYLAESTAAVTRVDKKIESLRAQFKSKDRLHIFDQHNNSYQSQNLKNAKAGTILLRTELKEFRGRVFEPPCLTVSATNKECTYFLETLLDLNTTVAFTCSDAEAYKKVSHVFFNERKLRASFRRLSGKSLPVKLSTERLQELGFEGYLKDFLDGPAPVIQMLSEEFFIHDVPVSRRPLSQEQISYLTSATDNSGQPLFRKFFAGNTLYNIQISRYGSRQMMIKTSTIKSSSRFFSFGDLTEERKQILNRQINDSQTEKIELEKSLEPLKNEISSIKSQIQSLESDLEARNSFVRKASSIRKEREKLNQKIISLEESCRGLEADSQRDYTREILKNESRIRDVLLKKIKLLTAFSNLQINFNTLAESLTILKVKKFEAENKKITLKKLTRNFEETLKKLENDYVDAKRRLSEYKNTDAVRKLKEETARYSEELKNQLSELIIKYKGLDKFSEDSIIDIIDGLHAGLKLLGNSSKSSVENFEKLKEQLDTLVHETKEYEDLLTESNKSMNKIRQDWEPNLSDLVSKISKKFSSIFPTVGIAGDVRIAKAERYQDWRLEILVKFREESDFKVLDSHTQSGGERAVSTVYYMISMQELTNSPFRAVDEINQGMDERNERIVHKHMVETACLEHTSQYFLITPKLLTGLYYAKNMRIHCIMAGPWTPSPLENSNFLSLGATSAYV